VDQRLGHFAEGLDLAGDRPAVAVDLLHKGYE
jgi:hypothetical protein